MTAVTLKACTLSYAPRHPDYDGFPDRVSLRRSRLLPGTWRRDNKGRLGWAGVNEATVSRATNP